MPDPDDFDQQLRNLTSGQAEPAKFTELSAAERLRRVPSPPQSPSRKRKPSRFGWRNARKARELRRPVGEPGRKPGGPGVAKRRRAPQGRPANAASRRKQRFLNAAKTVGVLVAFAALLYGLHLLGFGPH